VRWVAPAESASWQRGERLSFPEQTLAFQRADRTGEPAYAVPPVEPEHRAAIEVHVPVTSALRFSGTVVGLYAADELLRHVTPQWFFEKYRVVLENDDRVFSASSAVTAKTDVAESVSLDPPGHGLRLRVSAYALDSHVHFAIAVAFIGGLVVLMAWSLWALGAHTQRRLRAERERDELSDAVRRDHAFRKAMEESVVTGLRAVDMDGRITYVNPAFCEMVGFSAEELLGATPPFPYWPGRSSRSCTRSPGAGCAARPPAAGSRSGSAGSPASASPRACTSHPSSTATGARPAGWGPWWTSASRSARRTSRSSTRTASSRPRASSRWGRWRRRSRTS
jgi:two-component system sensor histidine kinase DctS